jgi:hypothetical protein
MSTAEELECRSRAGKSSRSRGAVAIHARLGILLAVAIVLVGAPVAGQAAAPGQVGRAAAAPDLATIVRCDPSVVYVRKTDIATTYLYVQDVVGLNAADLWLTFNTGIGNVVDEDSYTPGVQIQPLSEFMSADFVLFRSADNTLGQIHYAATQMAKPPRDGSGRLAMVRFQALATGTITLQFSLLHDLSDINGGLIPNTTQDCQVVFVEPTSIVLKRFIARPVGNIVHLRWETSAEFENVGFNLYRAQRPNGPRTKLNQALIPSKVPPGSPVGAVYDRLDRQVQPAKFYWYWLEDVDVYGDATLHGPVRVKTAP